MPKSRQLAAIMFTDIEGYTALMQKDEDRAVNIRERHREVFELTTAKHNGKILQYYGDGTLSIFSSAIEAVECGIEMQLAFQQWPQIPVRIGIHLGDIIHSKEEIIGDGVNVASRVESLAVAGSVFISNKVYDEIKNQVSISTKSMGPFEFKNVDQPMEIFAIANKGLVIPSGYEIAGKIKDKKEASGDKIPRPGKRRVPVMIGTIIALVVLMVAFLIFRESMSNGSVERDRSIVVLPFTNLSGDPENEYFSDGVTEDIIGQLAKISDLKVISRTSSMLYKSSTKNVQTIGEELGVSNILEGSVRRSGNKVRIVAQLIDAKTDEHLWSETFDMELIEVLTVQSKVAKEIANRLEAKLSSFERARLDLVSTQIPEVYDLYLKARFLQHHFQKDSYYKSIELFKQAIEIDPNFAPAYAGAASSYGALGSWIGDLPSKVALEKSMPYLQKALELDADLAIAQSTLAYLKFFFEWSFPEAESAFLKAAELDHSEIINLSGYHLFLNITGRFEEAAEWWEKSNSIDPLSIWNYGYMGTTLYFLNRPEDAIAFCQSAVEHVPYHPITYDKLGWVYYNTGYHEKTIEILNQSIQRFGVRPPSSLAYLALALNKAGQNKAALEILNELSERNQSGQKGIAFHLAVGYGGMGHINLAFEWLEKAYVAGEVDMIWLKIEPQFESMHEDPRYIDLLKRVGFPE